MANHREILKQISSDPDLKQRFLTQPKQVLAELGVEAADQELSEADLEQISGGSDNQGDESNQAAADILDLIAGELRGEVTSEEQMQEIDQLVNRVTGKQGSN
jgi:hypothetical protein